MAKIIKTYEVKIHMSDVCYIVNGDATGYDYYNTPDDNAGDRDKQFVNV